MLCACFVFPREERAKAQELKMRTGCSGILVLCQGSEAEVFLPKTVAALLGLVEKLGFFWLTVYGSLIDKNPCAFCGNY